MEVVERERGESPGLAFLKELPFGDTHLPLKSSLSLSFRHTTADPEAIYALVRTDYQNFLTWALTALRLTSPLRRRRAAAAAAASGAARAVAMALADKDEDARATEACFDWRFCRSFREE